MQGFIILAILIIFKAAYLFFFHLRTDFDNSSGIVFLKNCTKKTIYAGCPSFRGINVSTF